MNFHLALIAGWLGIAGVLHAGDRPPDADFLLVGDRGSIRRIAISVEIDGRPLDEIWSNAFARLFAFHDRDGDGKLSAAEAGRLPSPFALRQTLWNPVSQFGSRISSWKSLDENGDGVIHRKEMKAFYRRNGVGGVPIGAGRAPATDALTKSLLKHLDTDRNGAISVAEWKLAPDLLRRLDVNSDELLTPDELVPRLNYPGAAGSYRWTTDRRLKEQPAVIRALPLRLLPRQDAAAAHAIDRAQPKRHAVASTPVRTVVLRVRFSKAAALRRITADNVHVSIRVDDGKLQGQMESAANRLKRRFREADANGDGRLDRSEIAKKNQTDLQAMFAVADRDADGRLTAQELEEWMTMQRQLAAGQVLVSVLDFRRGLFERLDADGDGRLSLRELRSAAATIKPPSNGRFSTERLPWQVHLIVSRGLPESPLAAPRYDAPAWFRAMDRNHDGDVSPREFLGPRAAFRRLDRNRDQLISPAEAKLQ